jgi:hypothetical protein
MSSSGDRLGSLSRAQDDISESLHGLSPSLEIIVAYQRLQAERGPKVNRLAQRNTQHLAELRARDFAILKK